MKTVKENLDNILDCFGGADGGISFVNFKFTLEALEIQSNNGDENAKEILLLVDRFSTLINLIGRNE